MGFRAYIAKRIVVAIVVLFIIASLNFVLFQVVAPVDYVATIVDPTMTVEQRMMLRREFGLDQPYHVRYAIYLRNMFTWTFGLSFANRMPVIRELSWRLPNSILLLGVAQIAIILVGIPLGIWAGSKRGSKTDVSIIGSGLFAWGVPTFYVQLLFMLFFCYYLFMWFGIRVPVGNIMGWPPPQNPILLIADVAWHLWLPVLTLVVASFGGWALYVRNMMIDALTQDYIVTARAKGLSERTVLYRHAFRSSLPPIVTMIAMAVPGIVTGAMITEYIFSLPGIGQWYLSSLLAGDYPVVQAVLFIYAVLMISANLFSDLIYGILDPRIRVGMRR